jgi:hypothetical protein
MLPSRLNDSLSIESGFIVDMGDDIVGIVMFEDSNELSVSVAGTKTAAQRGVDGDCDTLCCSSSVRYDKYT